MWNKNNKAAAQKTASGLDVTVSELIALRSQVSHRLKLDRQLKRLMMSGQRITRSRGRGIEFAATREYQPGDDIRSMAWRLTARSLKPQVKVHHEEKERPVWLAVDLSPSLYFGTRCMFKSVASIKQASLLGWKYLFQQERIGVMIASNKKTRIYPPQSCENNFLTILKSFSIESQRKPIYDDSNYLYDLLKSLHQRVRSGNLIYILSDFEKFDEENQKLIAHIAQRTQLRFIYIYDPIEAQAPLPYQYGVTDGDKKAMFNMQSTQCRLQYQDQFQNKKNSIISFAQKHNISLSMLNTALAQEEWLI